MTLYVHVAVVELSVV